MEERKTIFDYLGQILMIFGIVILALNVFCFLVGENAREVSTMFSFGRNGLSVSTMMQFLMVSVIIVGLRFIFFSDLIIKKMSALARTIGMVLLVLAAMAVFIVIFDWFPVSMWQPWVLFFLCFGVSFVISTGLVVIKAKVDNKKMEEALKKIKQEEK